MRMTNQDSRTLEKLDQLYEVGDKAGPMVLNGKCGECGGEVLVEIDKTSDGYGINGGFVFAADDGQLAIKCIHCHQKGNILIIQKTFT
ncbi:MAG: hypothetical protein VR64_20535 [Desulfatitalea sp. BRH_c12]|nr:MAG: hypothetical protein VR64_20535 [Desulfatitalea sp. BRH_c12]